MAREDDESVSLTLQPGTGYNIAPAPAVVQAGVIVNDDFGEIDIFGTTDHIIELIDI